MGRKPRARFPFSHLVPPSLLSTLPRPSLSCFPSWTREGISFPTATAQVLCFKQVFNISYLPRFINMPEKIRPSSSGKKHSENAWLNKQQLTSVARGSFRRLRSMETWIRIFFHPCSSSPRSLFDGPLIPASFSSSFCIQVYESGGGEVRVEADRRGGGD